MERYFQLKRNIDDICLVAKTLDAPSKLKFNIRSVDRNFQFQLKSNENGKIFDKADFHKSHHNQMIHGPLISRCNEFEL